MLYGLVALAMGAMVGVGGGNAAPDTSLPDSAVVVSTEHRIEFPNRIVLQLEADGWKCIGPVEGSTACGEEGEGRMVEANEVVEAVEQMLAS